MTARLTPAEIRVLQACIEHRTTRNADLAKLLFVSPNTIHSHFEHIKDTFNVRTRSAAILAAIELGELTPPGPWTRKITQLGDGQAEISSIPLVQPDAARAKPVAVTNYYSLNGEIIGEKVGANPRVDYLTDGLGSVTGTVNQSAQVVNTYRYKPFGGLLAKTGAGPDPAFQWVGQRGYRPTSKKWSDVYVVTRHYAADLGQWSSVDLLWPDEQPYVYVGARPTVDFDPDGCSVQQTCPSGWEDASASLWHCEEKAKGKLKTLGTTCMRCRVILKQWPTFDKCRWAKDYKKRFTPQSCYCPIVLGPLGLNTINVAARRRADDDCGQKLEVMDWNDPRPVSQKRRVTVTVVDEGPHGNNAGIDLYDKIWPDKLKGPNTFPVCIRRVGVDLRVTHCKNGFNSRNDDQENRK